MYTLRVLTFYPCKSKKNLYLAHSLCRNIPNTIHKLIRLQISQPEKEHVVFQSLKNFSQKKPEIAIGLQILLIFFFFKCMLWRIVFMLKLYQILKFSMQMSNFQYICFVSSVNFTFEYQMSPSVK